MPNITTAPTNKPRRPITNDCLDVFIVIQPFHYLNHYTGHYTPRGVYTASMIADIKRRALHRSKILQGQLKGIEKMIENEDYCMDIITQSLAIQKSLSSLNKLLVENHIRTHVRDAFSSTNEKQQQDAINELLGLYELTHVRGK